MLDNGVRTAREPTPRVLRREGPSLLGDAIKQQASKGGLGENRRPWKLKTKEIPLLKHLVISLRTPHMMPYDKPCVQSSNAPVLCQNIVPKHTFTILGVDAGVSNDDGRPAREGGRMELAVFGREIWAEATETEVEGRDTADATDADAEVENMDCQTMPSVQSLRLRGLFGEHDQQMGEGERGHGGGGSYLPSKYLGSEAEMGADF